MTPRASVHRARASGTAVGHSLSVLCSDIEGHPALQETLSAMVVWSVGEQVHTAIGDAQWPLVSSFAREHRVLPALNRITDRRTEGGDSQSDLLTALAVEHALLTSTALLRSHGIDSLVLKGNATAHLDYDTPDDRVVGDVDLLVRERDFSRTIEVLANAGYTRRVTHPFATAHFMHSETLMHPAGVEIDVHHRFHQSSRAPISCWDEAVEFTVGGQSVFAPSLRWRFVHACVHQMMNRPPALRRASGLLDACRIYSSPGFSLGQSLAAAREVRLEAVTIRCVEHLRHILDEPVVPIPPGSHFLGDRWLASIVDGTEPIPGYASFITSIVNQRWRDRPRYVRELLWPTERYRAEVGRTPIRQLIHVAREIAGR